MQTSNLQWAFFTGLNQPVHVNLPCILLENLCCVSRPGFCSYWWHILQPSYYFFHLHINDSVNREQCWDHTKWLLSRLNLLCDQLEEEQCAKRIILVINIYRVPIEIIFLPWRSGAVDTFDFWWSPTACYMKHDPKPLTGNKKKRRLQLKSRLWSPVTLCASLMVQSNRWYLHLFRACTAWNSAIIRQLVVYWYNLAFEHLQLAWNWSSASVALILSAQWNQTQTEKHSSVICRELPRRQSWLVIYCSVSSFVHRCH